MAIWPFGRKSKRHTIQLDAAATQQLHLSQEPRHSFDDSKLGHTPSRKHSKRQKNRHSQPVDDYSSPYQDASFPSSKPTPYPLRSSHSEQVHSLKGMREQTSKLGHHVDGYTSYSTVCRDQPTRTPSLLKAKQNGNGPAVLKKKLSKRKAYEIAREREIRLMASSPIDIPRRATTPLPGDGRHRRSDRHLSELSLSIRDSAASSLSEFSDTYKFKVNGFAAWTPRPVIRYVEAPPRAPSARSQRTPDESSRRDKTPAVSAGEEDFHPRKRVDTLADDLDAGGLRELLERDRRRRERKQVEDQEKLQRKLQREAERQPEVDADQELSERDAGQQALPEEQQTIPDPDSRVQPDQPNEDASAVDETDNFPTDAPPSSWLRVGSKDTERSGLDSMESIHVIGNLDDSSVRERKLGMRSSFAPSQDMDMGMSRSTLSPSRSTSRHGLNSPSSSQVYGMGRESISDLSRTIDSERRMSEHSAGHASTITSIFRRGSSRLKRRYRERFQERSPDAASTSHESFFKVSAPSPAATPYVPPRTFLQTGTIKRSQSKFTEHFGDDLVSPSESRIQSPDIPEESAGSADMEMELEPENPTSHVGTQYPIPGSERHDSVDGEVDNVPLSQSLASIDSEGSWMSGQFLRHISQKKSNAVRPSIGSLRNRLEEGEDSPKDDKFPEAGDDQEMVNSINNVVGDQTAENNDLRTPEKSEETWHHEIAKRPILVTPAMRPKSTEGLLNNVQSWSAEEEFSPIEEHSAELHFVNEADRANGHGH